MDDYKECLRRLAVRDDALIATVLANEPSREESGLDARSYALVRVSATVAVEAGQSSYQHAVERALAAGATPDQIVGTLVAVMSLTGVPRAIAGASKLALALGYDLDEALEGFDIYRKFGVSSRAEAIERAVQLGLLEDSSYQAIGPAR